MARRGGGSFWDVTFPLLRPFVAIAVLLRTLEAFKTFGTIRVLTGGGPGISTEIINLTIYRTALQDFSVGAAASLGIAFLVFLRSWCRRCCAFWRAIRSGGGLR